MAELLRKMFLLGYEKRTIREIEDVAEGAALMQEQHARDVVSMAETAGVRPTDPRVERARKVVERLR